MSYPSSVSLNWPLKHAVQVLCGASGHSELKHVLHLYFCVLLKNNSM